MYVHDEEGTCYSTHVEAHICTQFIEIRSLHCVGSENQAQAIRLDGNIFTYWAISSTSKMSGNLPRQSQICLSQAGSREQTHTRRAGLWAEATEDLGTELGSWRQHSPKLVVPLSSVRVHATSVHLLVSLLRIPLCFLPHRLFKPFFFYPLINMPREWHKKVATFFCRSLWSHVTENVNNTTVFHQSNSIGECYYWLFFGLKCNFPQIANFNSKTFLEVEGRKKTVFVISKPLPLHLFPYAKTRSSFRPMALTFYESGKRSGIGF